MLNDYATALRDEGYDVLEASEEPGDRLGFIVIDTTVEIEGEEFDAELMVIVYPDRISDHGVDIFSRPGESFSDDREKVLDEVASTRDVLGEDDIAWTYHAGTAEDDIDEMMADLREVYKDVQAEAI